MRLAWLPSLLLCACATSTSAGPGSATPSATTQRVDPTLGAYLVYTARRTLVIPNAAAREVEVLDGLLVMEDAHEHVPGEAHFVLIEDTIPDDAACPCPSTPGACEVDDAPFIVVADRDDTGVHVRVAGEDQEGMAEACACLVSRSRRDDEDYDDACEGYEAAGVAVSLFDGVLYVNRYESPSCDDGASMIDAIPVASRARASSVDATGPFRCVTGTHFDPARTTSARPVDCASPETSGEPECRYCAEPDEGFLATSRGRLYTLAPSSEPYEDVTAFSSVPLSPERCGPYDTCGDASGLPIPAGASFWVANDGASALVYHGDRWLVVLRDHAEAARVEVRPHESVIGVRYHADARALFAELASGALAAAARGATELPMARAPRPTGRCASDEDCATRGHCASFCSEDGVCRDSYDHCDATHECLEASVCQLDTARCVAALELVPSATDRLAPRDAAYARRPARDQGRGWLTRCREHLARGRLDEAYAACVRGLHADATPRVAAELTRSLARVATARRRYQEASAFDDAADMLEIHAEEEEDVEAEATPRPQPRRRQR